MNSLINAGPPHITDEAFIQHVFDNADINVRTLDGMNTFHAMGVIQFITPHSSVQMQVNVERTYSGSFSHENIRIRCYPKKHLLSCLSSIFMKDFNELKEARNILGQFVTTMFPLNMLWLSGVNNQPEWKGLMNTITSRKDECIST